MFSKSSNVHCPLETPKSVPLKSLSDRDSFFTFFPFPLRKLSTPSFWFCPFTPKGGFKSEETGKILRLQHKYSKLLSWAENLNKLFTVLGGKFKFSAQDRDLKYLCWRCKNSPVSSEVAQQSGLLFHIFPLSSSQTNFDFVLLLLLRWL